MSDFFERYNNLNNLELLKIIANQSDYQSAAIETAKRILVSRQVSDDEIKDAKEEISRQNQEKYLQTEKKKTIENKVKNFGATVVETINPIQTSVQSSNKTILIISIVLALIFLIDIYQNYPLIFYILTDSEASWEPSMFLYYSPIILLPIGIVFFWLRKQFGWWVLSIYFLNILIYVITGMITYTYMSSSNDFFSSWMPQNTFSAYAWPLIFNGGLFWVICKENIRSVYNIDKKKMFTAIGISVVFTAITMVGMFM